MTLQSSSGSGGGKLDVAGYLIAVGIPVTAVLALAIGGHAVQARLCPPDTLVAGPTLFGFVGIFLGALLAGSGLLIVCGGLAFRRSGISLPPVYRPILVTIRVMAIVWTGLSLVLWIAGVFAYYCAGARTIVVHPSPLTPAVTYGWSDVRRIDAGCWRRSGGPYLKLQLADGRSLDLAGFMGSWLAAQHTGVGAALAAVPYVYDVAGVADCSSDYREILSKRPS